MSAPRQLSVSVSFRFTMAALFGLTAVAFGQPPEPAVKGYVTRAASSSDFDVNGFHVLLTGKTSIERQSGSGDLNLYVGRAIWVYGSIQRKSHSITATKLTIFQPELKKLDATGVIDGVLPTPPNASSPDDHLVRADGYLVLISAATATTFNPPLDSNSAFQPNIWLSFQGTQRADGVIVAAKATFSKNVITPGEDKLRAAREYDPKAVGPDSKQSGLSKAFLGLNPKLIPPYNDPVMQARVDAVGAKLVPKYQRELPDTDESKINFRFQVVDQKKWHDALTLPSGIVLIPHQVVERMQNDSQLATVLADNMATVLEKQMLRLQPAGRAMTATQLAGTAGGLFIPGLGLATSAANFAVSKELQRHLNEESGRVSLFLLHDAGYDIFQAPLAWWLLASSKGIANGRPPQRAKYIYQILGETWRDR